MIHSSAEAVAEAVVEGCGGDAVEGEEAVVGELGLVFGEAHFFDAPDAAVGEDTPADAPVRVDVGCRQVAEQLSVRRTGPAAVVAVACVQGQAEALALGNREGVAVARRGRLVHRTGFGLCVAEEQMIGDVFVAVAALLGKVVVPTEQFEQRADQLLLGGGLVDGVKVGGICEKGERLGAEGIEP